MSFWEKNVNNVPVSQQNIQEMDIDQDVMFEITGEAPQDLFEEEEQDVADLMRDANLRLEQGRLYQMVLQNDIFAQTNADPRAIKNVQREIRNFVKDRMEIMLGIRQSTPVQERIVSSPFNDMEVTVLKMLASKMSKGATDQPQQQLVPQAVVQPVKKDGITAISGTLRSAPVSPSVSNKPSLKDNNTVQKPIPKKQTPIKSAINKEEESNLQKPIDQMSTEELAAHNKAAEERSLRKRSAVPANLIPHPNPNQLEMLYTGMAANMSVKLAPKF